MGSVKKYLVIIFFLAGAITMLVMSLHYFQEDVTGVMKGKVVKDELWYRLSLRAHIFLGLIAILIGPFQFIDSLRIKNRNTHRRLGYVYATSVFLSAMAGLVVAQFPMGGILSRLGFSTLAIFWLISLFKSIKAILSQEILQHRKWMFINYGLTFAAIPQRTLLLLPLALDLDFMNIYRLSAWLPWIMNTAIAIIWHSKSSKTIVKTLDSQGK